MPTGELSFTKLKHSFFVIISILIRTVSISNRFKTICKLEANE